MSSIQESHETYSKSYIKLAHFYQHLSYDVQTLERILQLEGDINFKLPCNSCLALRQPEFIGNTALHFVSDSYKPEIIAKLLIDHGADFTITNAKGFTVLHLVFNELFKGCHSHRDDIMMLRGQLQSSFIDLILSAHVQRQNWTNPRDPCGFSHFHAACVTNNTIAVEFFLNNGVSIDEAVYVDSPMFPGFTPLHLAARCGCVDVANLLVSRGADVYLKDAIGMTPLHLSIERNMRLWYLHDEESIAQVENNDSIIVNILSNEHTKIFNRRGLTAFHALCTLKDTSFVEKFVENDINRRIDEDSPFLPGYTGLHFAARFNIDTFKLLLSRGADIKAKDANGVTPFDLCVGRHDVKDIHEIISNNISRESVVLSDGKTKLLDLILAMQSAKDFRVFIDKAKLRMDTSIPIDSSLWPGSTPLHLAVTLEKKQMIERHAWWRLFFPGIGHELNEIRINELIKVCLRSGASVTAQDLHGSTALHLAIRRFEYDNIELLLNSHVATSNPVDKDNLSHLHIACIMKNENLVKKLLLNGANVNGAVSSTFQWDQDIQYSFGLDSERYFIICGGSTPLHVAVSVQSRAIMKMLIDYGADLNAKDVNGLTPLHNLFLITEKPNVQDILSQYVLKDCVTNGLSYLHVACVYNNLELTIKLLNLGVDVNSTILPWDRRTENDLWEKSYYEDDVYRNGLTIKLSSFFNYYEGATPLSLTLKRPRLFGIAKALLAYRPDVFAKDSKGHALIYDVLQQPDLIDSYVCYMNDDDEKRLLSEMGITMLHLACLLPKEELIKNCIKNGADVNAQIHNDSEIWKGYTPLHILMMKAKLAYSHQIKTFCRLIRLLLDNGADATIADVRGETPALLNVDGNLHERNPCVGILLQKLKHTGVNPVSMEGISHFHLACIRNDVALVKRFLKLGIDVNQRVSYFSNQFAGCTPLHLAAAFESDKLFNGLPSLRIVHLLLKYGADVNAVDVRGDTPLYYAAKHPALFMLPFRRMIWAGADTGIKNYNDEVPEVRSNRFDVGEMLWNLYAWCCWPCRKIDFCDCNS